MKIIECNTEDPRFSMTKLICEKTGIVIGQTWDIKNEKVRSYFMQDLESSNPSILKITSRMFEILKKLIK